MIVRYIAISSERSLFILLFHHRWFIAAALGTEPSSLGFVQEIHAVEMEPFDWTSIIVATNHLPVRYLRKKDAQIIWSSGESNSDTKHESDSGMTLLTKTLQLR